MRLRLSICYGLLGTALSVWLWAQAPTADESVTIWGERPQAILRYHDQVNLSEPAQALGQTLEQDLALHVRDFGSALQSSYLQVRGLDAKNLTVMINDVPFQSAFAPALDLSLLPPGLFGLATLKYQRDQGGQQLDLNQAAADTGIFTVRQEVGGSQYFLQSLHAAWATSNVAITRRVSQGDYAFTNNRNTFYNLADDFYATRTNNDAAQIALVGNVALASDGPCQALHLLYSDTNRGVPGSLSFPSDTAREHHALAQVSVDGQWLGHHHTFWYGRHDYSFSDLDGDLTGIATQLAMLDQRVGFHLASDSGLSPEVTVEQEALQSDSYRNPRRVWAMASVQPKLSWLQGTLLPCLWGSHYSDVPDTWGASLAYLGSVMNWGTVRVGVGSMGRAPSFGELYFDQGLIQGNPDLRPEQGWQWDAAIEANWLSCNEFTGIQGKISYYQIYQNDLIQWVYPGGFRMKSLNVAEAQLKGLETKLALADLMGMRLEWKSAYTSAIDGATGLGLAGRPTMEQRLSVEKECFGWLTRTSYIYESGTAFASGSSAQINNRSVVNLGADGSCGDHAQIYFKVDNLLDAPQQDMFGFPLPGRTFLTGIKLNYS